MNRLLSYLVMLYMLLAFSWWAMLLYGLNEELYSVRKNLLVLELKQAGGIEWNQQTPVFQSLELKHRRQQYMILGEGAVFIMTLLSGLWFINKAYQREMQANSQSRNFLLAITHELKSPVASIRLLLETLLKRDLPPDKSKPLMQSALRENDRLLELVENLLLSARLEKAYRPLFEPLNLHSLLNDLVAKLKMRHPEALVTLESDPEMSSVNADKDGLSAAVANLLENAVKYSPTPARIHIKIYAQGENCVLEVSDQGLGIPDDEKKLVFKKFYRSGFEETRQHKGTGLGLFIVAEVVKAHKGKIFVLDNQPTGTIFRIVWPLLLK